MMKGKFVKLIAMAAVAAIAVVVAPKAVKASTETIHPGYVMSCGGRFVAEDQGDNTFLYLCSKDGSICDGLRDMFESGKEIHPFSEADCAACHPEKNCKNHKLEWYSTDCDPNMHQYGCVSCGYADCDKAHKKGKGGSDCTLCNDPHKKPADNKSEDSKKDDDKKEEKKEESKPKDLNKEAFGGREASQLSVTEQKSAVSYAIDSLRASGNALAANVVTSNNGGNGKASDIAAVVADNRDAANQQIFAQVACANLGFKNVTPLATYNMYSLHSSYTAKNGAQVITWANTGLKAGDTAFVVWYNQKLGKIELLPALVDANGNVLVNVPALGDVSTMTVVKASK